MSYVLNPTGRSNGRSRRCRNDGCVDNRAGCGCGNGCGGCGGCSGGCGGYGCYHHHCGCARAAKRSDSLPVVYTTSDCACPCGCPEPYVRNVIYTGPCPPSPDCPCQPPLPPPPPDPPCYRPVPCVNSYAYFAQTGILSVVDASDAIALQSVSDVTCDSFEFDEGIITVNRAGTYLATFSMSLPADAEVNTQISMTLDGVTLPGSAVSVSKTPGSPGSVVTQAVFTVTSPTSEFAVVSSAPFYVMAETSDDTVASLTITQIAGGLFPAQYVV